MAGAVTIISRHFKIFIPVPPSNAPDTVCTRHLLASHHLPSTPVCLWSVQSPHKSGNHRLRGRTVPLEYGTPRQDSLTTHSIYQGYFHTGKLNVGGHQVYSLRVMQDTLAGMNRLIHQDMPHSIRQCKWQLVRLRISQADCQASLWVPVDQKHFLSDLCQTYSQVRTGCCFANAAFLVGDGDDLRVQINLLLLQKISLFRKIGMKKAAYSNK